MSSFRGAVALLALLTPTPNGLSAQAPPAIEDIQRLLDERTTANVPGITAAIIANGTARTWASGRRRESGTPPDATTLFEIGSVSKLFTGLLLADMVLRGEVALTDIVAAFLPSHVSMPSRGGREITLLDLATHTSGLPRLPTNLLPANLGNPYAAYGEDELYAFLSGYVLQRDPGDVYEYSNLGAGLLGHVLALRSGMLYEDLVKQRILRPLGMHDTSITLDRADRGRLATGHGADGTVVGNWDFNVLAGAGGWRSSPDDMLRFLHAVARSSDETLAEAVALATTPHRDTAQPGLRVGLGWHIRTSGERQFLLHNGRTGGYYAFVGVDPDTRTGALLLANVSAPLDDVGIRLLEVARTVTTSPLPVKEE